MPTSPSAQQILANRGITILPDFVANAGGVIAAAFAMDSRYSGFRGDTDTVFRTISDKLRSNTHLVLDTALSGRRVPCLTARNASSRSCGRWPPGRGY
nr:hypothetical protein [Saccharopolyspora pogona]